MSAPKFKATAVCLVVGTVVLWGNLVFADTALIGGTVHTVSGETLDGATVLISGDKIAAVGTDVQIPSGIEQVDVSGLHVYPGMIAANTTLGLIEIRSVI